MIIRSHLFDLELALTFNAPALHPWAAAERSAGSGPTHEGVFFKVTDILHSQCPEHKCVS